MAITSTSPLSESLENYLEAIYQILSDKPNARPKDIAALLRVSNASVTAALHTLSDKKYIRYTPYDSIALTPKGREVAKEICRRHALMKDFLIDFLRVSPEEADENACRLEHVLSPDLIDRFARLATFLRNCPRGGSFWIAGFEHHCDQDTSCERCEKCVYQVLERVQERQRNLVETKNFHTTCKLSELHEGQKGCVAKLDFKGVSEKKFAQMGILPGEVVQVGRADFGSPIEIYVHGSCFSIARKEAARIWITLNDE